MTRKEITNKILDYFKDNEEIFNACIEELDSWNGYLGNDRYYDMEELNEFYAGSDPLELLQRVYFGWAEGKYTIDQWGEKHLNEFNPNADYFRYNVYGNLVSTNYKDYSDRLDEHFIEALLEGRANIDSIDDEEELAQLFDELEKLEEKDAQ